MIVKNTTQEETVIIRGVKYQAIDTPLSLVDRPEFYCSNCDIYKAKIPQHFSDVPICCEGELEYINKYCYELYEKGIRRIWKIT